MNLGLGTAPLGNLYHPVDDAAAVATVDRAIALGVAVIDAAPLYGVGLAEERIGAALAALAPGALRPAISTKVGRVIIDGRDPGSIFEDGRDRHAVHDLSADGIRRSLEASLIRLGLGRVDIALLHDPDDHAEDAIKSAFPALRALRDEGLASSIGAGMNQAEMLERFVVEVGVDVVLLAGRWTLLDHREPARHLLDRCAAEGVRVLIGGALNSGLLAGGDTFDYVAAPPALVARRGALTERCAVHGVPLAAVALQFPSLHPAVDTVVLGARSPDEVDAGFAAVSTAIPRELWDDLCDAGLLDRATVFE